MMSMEARSATAGPNSSDEIIAGAGVDLDVGQTSNVDEKVGLHSTADDKRELSVA